MKRLDVKIMQSTTCRDDLTVKDMNGSGSGFKDGLKAAGFQIGDEAVVVLKQDLEDMIDSYSKMASRFTSGK